MAAAGRPLYNWLVRKNYIFLGVIFGSAFAFEMTFDTVTDGVWDRINKGRQWKDIRARYIQDAEGDDDE